MRRLTCAGDYWECVPLTFLPWAHLLERMLTTHTCCR